MAAWMDKARQHLHAWHILCKRSITDMPVELSMRQWAVMSYIYLNEGRHSITSLAHIFALPKPSICRIIDGLSKLDYVTRRTDLEDRRHIILGKTLKGIAFLNQFMDILEKHSNAPAAQENRKEIV